MANAATSGYQKFGNRPTVVTTMSVISNMVDLRRSTLFGDCAPNISPPRRFHLPSPVPHILIWLPCQRVSFKKWDIADRQLLKLCVNADRIRAIMHITLYFQMQSHWRKCDQRDELGSRALSWLGWRTTKEGYLTATEGYCGILEDFIWDCYWPGEYCT